MFQLAYINHHPNIALCATIKLQFWGGVQLETPIYSSLATIHHINSNLFGTKTNQFDISAIQHFNDCAVFTKVALLLNPSSDIILTASKPL
jgi:hypothetical protein